MCIQLIYKLKEITQTRAIYVEIEFHFSKGLSKFIEIKYA